MALPILVAGAALLGIGAGVGYLASKGKKSGGSQGSSQHKQLPKPKSQRSPKPKNKGRGGGRGGQVIQQTAISKHKHIQKRNGTTIDVQTRVVTQRKRRRR